METSSNRFKEYENRQQTGARRVNLEFAAEIKEALRHRKDIFPDTLIGNCVEQGSAATISTVKRNLKHRPKYPLKNPRRAKVDNDISKCVSLFEKIVEEQRKIFARRLDILDKIANSLTK